MKYLLLFLVTASIAQIKSDIKIDQPVNVKWTISEPIYYQSITLANHVKKTKSDTIKWELDQDFLLFFDFTTKKLYGIKEIKFIKNDTMLVFIKRKE